MCKQPYPFRGTLLLCLTILLFGANHLQAQPTIQNINTATNSGPSLHSITGVPAGALLVIACQTETANTSSTISSLPSLTWTKRADAQHTDSSGDSEIWTAVYSAGGSIQVQSSFGGGRHSSVLYVITGQESSLGGASAATTRLSQPQATITTTRANSIIIGGISDWNAISASPTKTYTGSPTETLYEHVSSAFTTYNFYKAAASTGNYTLGVTVPSGQKGGTALYEIRAPGGGGGGDTDPPSSFTLSVTEIRPRTVCLSWTEATDNVGVTGYDVYVGGVLNGSTETTIYTVEGLTNNTQYSIYVKAKDAATNSTNSNTTTPTTLSTSRPNLIEELTFEQSAVADAYLVGWKNDQHDLTAPWAVNQSATQARNGTKSLKIDLRVDDEIQSNSIRAEIEPVCTIDHETMERWYGGSWYLQDWASDIFGESILQWHDIDESSPPLAIHTYDNHLWLASKSGVYDLGEVASNEWTDIVIHVKWALAETGKLECWRDGVKLVDEDNISTNSFMGSYLKLGINKWNWAPPLDPEESEVEQRIFYIDDFRIGDENASYADVSPTGEEPPTPPASELTLVTANPAAGLDSSSHALTSVPAGALLVLACQTESGGSTSTVNSYPGLTWTKRVDAQAGSSGDSEIWTAVFTAGGNIRVTSDFGNSRHSSVCYVITGQEAVLGGASNSATGQSAPFVTLTTTRANSIVIAGVSDWNAINGSSRTYRKAPVTETLYHRTVNAFTSYNFYKAMPSVVTDTFGLSVPSGQSSGTVLYEVRPQPSGARIMTQPPVARAVPANEAKQYFIAQNYPNPFSGQTTIRYGLPQPAQVNITVLDVSGRLVQQLVQGRKDAGVYTIPFNANRLAKGVYYYRMQAGSFVAVKKLIVQ